MQPFCVASFTEHDNFQTYPCYSCISDLVLLYLNGTLITMFTYLSMHSLILSLTYEKQVLSTVMVRPGSTANKRFKTSAIMNHACQSRRDKQTIKQKYNTQQTKYLEVAKAKTPAWMKNGKCQYRKQMQCRNRVATGGFMDNRKIKHLREEGERVVWTSLTALLAEGTASPKVL